MQPIYPEGEDYSQRVERNPNPASQPSAPPPAYYAEVASDTAPAGYISISDLAKILEENNQKLREEFAQREREKDAEVARVRALIPNTLVQMNGGGPGVNNHQRSWSLVEQEHAARGEILDHWEGVRV